MARIVGRRSLTRAAFGATALLIADRPSAADGPVMIYAAATLKNALDTVVEAARTALHVHVTPVYGPSPALVQQLQNGAPGDIFFSADSDWMDEAVVRGVVQPSSRVDLLSSTLVLIAPAAQKETVTIGPGFPLAALLGTGRLAMCDPMMMPVGRYSRSALQSLGVWESVKDRVANAADVLAALAYVSRREAALGIVFATDAGLDQGVRVVGTFPPDSHPPIVYPLATVAHRRNPDTTRVFGFVTSATARSIFVSYGYSILNRSD